MLENLNGSFDLSFDDEIFRPSHVTLNLDSFPYDGHISSLIYYIGNL